MTQEKTVQFYLENGFCLFPCNVDKSPRVPSWRSTEHHLTAEKALSLMETSVYVGAWLPKHVVIVDLDKNHGDSQIDGEASFTKVFGEVPNTFTVRTGSGGKHLYFTIEGDYSRFSQKSIATAIDVRTHLGYVIAAGTAGYTVINDAPMLPLPAAIEEQIEKKTADKAVKIEPQKPLSVKFLAKLLNKIPTTDFATNDTWQEFVTSCIAVSGNSDSVIDAIAQWSRQDKAYEKDESIERRLKTFEPDGGITAGTFIHILKQQGISKYLINQVRTQIGAQFNFSESFSDDYETPFAVDYGRIADLEDMARSFYYTKHQTAGVQLFAHLVKDELLFSAPERCFYYYDGNRWIPCEGIQAFIFATLLKAGIHFYTDYSQKKDSDADDLLNSYILYIGSLSILSRFEASAKQHPLLVRQHIDFDSPELEGTLTLRDAVMDFSTKAQIVFRKGRKEEYRKRYIDLPRSAFEEAKTPKNFRQMLKDIFPNDETRKTATYALATMLSGTGKFRKFQIWNGSGSNGKSTLMEAMKMLIGDRAISYRSEVLLSKTNANSLTPELAAFRGALVAFASETEESKRISQGSVKALTGNETMAANPKYKDVVEFRTTFQLVLSTNYLPTFSAHDAAFIDRLLVLPFYTCFYKDEEQKERAQEKGAKYFVQASDPEMLFKSLKAERADILFYLAKRYQELGATIPESKECKNSKSLYVEDNNDIVNFIHDFIEFHAEADWFTPTKDIVEFYNEENNTRYSSKFVMMRLKEVYPLIETHSKSINGKLTRGVKHVRIKVGAYPEGYQGNYTRKEAKVIEGAF